LRKLNSGLLPCIFASLLTLELCMPSPVTSQPSPNPEPSSSPSHYIPGCAETDETVDVLFGLPDFIQHRYADARTAEVIEQLNRRLANCRSRWLHSSTNSQRILNVVRDLSLLSLGYIGEALRIRKGLHQCTDLYDDIKIIRSDTKYLDNSDLDEDQARQVGNANDLADSTERKGC